MGRVLIGCECSGIVRDAFKARGHFAMSCDMKETQRPGNHYVGDVFDLDWDWFDLAIFHPPCTNICNSSSKHLYIDGWLENGRDVQRWHDMQRGAEFFKRCYNWNAPRVACENPVMLGYARDHADIPKATQFVQPWMFGHPEQKKTGLWLRNLPKLKETNNVYAYMVTLPEKERNRIHYMGPNGDRGEARSETYPGIADAFADQWGALI